MKSSTVTPRGISRRGRKRGGPAKHAKRAPAPRAYRSQLREQQAEQTRELIVAALADQVWQDGLADFSVPKVAKRANVATRTVYRYFPTRDDLLDAVGEWLRKHAPEPAIPRDLDDLTRYVRELYAYFDRHPQLVDLQGLPTLGREVQQRWRAVRAAGSRQLLESWLPELTDERERLRRFAPIRVLLGSRSWLQMTRELGLSSDEAADATCAAIEVLVGTFPRGGN
jgi:AcrR family transcriptional regulator